MKPITKILILAAFAIVMLGFAPARPVLASTINIPCSVPDLIAAINTANSTPEPDTLRLVDPCTYLLDAIDNTSVEFGPNGLPVITTKIIIEGRDHRIKRRDEETVPNFRFFLVAPTGVLVLRGIELNSGKAAFPETPNVVPRGGAIYNNQGKVRLKDVRFLFNQYRAAAEGGAIFNDAGNLRWVRGYARWNTGVRGGLVYNTAGARLSLNQVEIWKSYADFGAGIYNLGQADLRRVFSHWTFSTEGGAISNHGTMTVNASIFTQNRATLIDNGVGGAIANFGPLEISNSSFWQNDAGSGGAIWNQGSILLTNSTLNRNGAMLQGGGILNRGTMELLNVTLAENSAGNGKGGNLRSKPGASTIVANTIITAGYPQNCIGELQVEGGNLRYPETDPTCAGEYGDPMLDIWQHYGGPTQAMALKPGSRAINKGLRENCLRVPVNNLDQRGITRIVGDELRCESGAYEIE